MQVWNHIETCQKHIKADFVTSSALFLFIPRHSTMKITVLLSILTAVAAAPVGPNENNSELSARGNDGTGVYPDLGPKKAVDPYDPELAPQKAVDPYDPELSSEKREYPYDPELAPQKAVDPYDPELGSEKREYPYNPELAPQKASHP